MAHCSGRVILFLFIFSIINGIYFSKVRVSESCKQLMLVILWKLGENIPSSFSAPLSEFVENLHDSQSLLSISDSGNVQSGPMDVSRSLFAQKFVVSDSPDSSNVFSVDHDKLKVF